MFPVLIKLCFFFVFYYYFTFPLYSYAFYFILIFKSFKKKIFNSNLFMRSLCGKNSDYNKSYVIGSSINSCDFNITVH